MALPVIGVAVGLRVPDGDRLLREEIFLPTRYLTPLLSAGALPTPFFLSPDPEVMARQYERVDAVHLIGGDDIPGEYFGESTHPTAVPLPTLRVNCETALVRRCLTDGKPIFGICCGAQMMNVALGGSLIQDIPSQIDNPLDHRHPETRRSVPHEIECRDDSLLAEVAGRTRFRIMSSHHQSVKQAGKDLRIVAEASDGVIEAVEMPEHPFFLGVQWHPELEPEDEVTRRLYAAFVRAAQGNG